MTTAHTATWYYANLYTTQNAVTEKYEDLKKLNDIVEYSKYSLKTAISNLFHELAYITDSISGVYTFEDNSDFVDDINKVLGMTPTSDILSSIGQSLIIILQEETGAPCTGQYSERQNPINSNV